MSKAIEKKMKFFKWKTPYRARLRPHALDTISCRDIKEKEGTLKCYVEMAKNRLWVCKRQDSGFQAGG
jgi:hypothetical protein